MSLRGDPIGPPLIGFCNLNKNNKKYHFNNHEDLNYKIPSGSLNLDIALSGGLTPGAHRFTGVNEGGKTSCSLAFAKNFQKHFDKDGSKTISFNEFLQAIRVSTFI